MSQHLTVAYITNRKENHFEWFIESLNAQRRPEDDLSVVVVDFYADDFIRERPTRFLIFPQLEITRVAPKPTVWQGKYRLTQEDWFAAANARNTALCLARDGWIAYVDDLSVLLPGWLQAVREAIAGNYVVLGTYQKVRNLVVGDGVVKSFEEYPAGMDTRLPFAKGEISPASGSWLFGCSLAAPVEALLKVGGFGEYCDGLGAEDYALGIALQNSGVQFRFDKRMKTLESEDLHANGKVFIRRDKGVSPRDKSHAALEIAMRSDYFPNYYEGGIRKMREEVLAGKPFPIVQIPDRDWYDGQLISEMT